MLESLLSAPKKDSFQLIQLSPLTLPLAAGTVVSNFFTAKTTDTIVLSMVNNAPRIANSANEIPRTFIPGDSDDFSIEAELNLSNTNVAILIGNLNNSNGQGTYWMTLNNTYGVVSQISLDGFDTSGAIQRFRFGGGKLPTSVWFKISLKRISGVLSAYLDDTMIGSPLSMPKGFRSNGVVTPLNIGVTTDNSYKITGNIRNFKLSVR